MDPVLASPRRLRSTIHMAVYTHDTQKLIGGRPAAQGKSAIIGLFGFAERLRHIWEAANASDPYAAWWLLRVEDAYSATVAKIDAEWSLIRERFDGVAEFDIELADTDPLCRIELNFACPYAYWGAKVLKTYDELVQAVTMAERLGLRRRQLGPANRFRCERKIRALFAAALGYHSLSITLNDVKQGTAVAEEARRLMGDIPPAILSGERSPALLAFGALADAIDAGNAA